MLACRLAYTVILYNFFNFKFYQLYSFESCPDNFSQHYQVICILKYYFIFIKLHDYLLIYQALKFIYQVESLYERSLFTTCNCPWLTKSVSKQKRCKENFKRRCFRLLLRSKYFNYFRFKIIM